MAAAPKSLVTFKLKWTGEAVEHAILAKAVPQAMDDTTAAAAIASKSSHPGWKNRTGIAEGSIRGDPAVPVGSTRWVALFGSFDVAYFIWLEIGARGRSGDYTLRRGADKEFPKLPDRIRARAKALKAIDK